MEYLKNLGKSLLYIFSIIIVSTFIITFFNYFNIIGSKILSILKILTILFGYAFQIFMILQMSLKQA